MNQKMLKFLNCKCKHPYPSYDVVKDKRFVFCRFCNFHKEISEKLADDIIRICDTFSYQLDEERGIKTRWSK
jgi:hypothetical protein